jgi:hypothetical protein
MDENPYKSPEHQSIQDRSLEASLPHGEEIVAQIAARSFSGRDRLFRFRSPVIGKLVVTNRRVFFLSSGKGEQIGLYSEAAMIERIAKSLDITALQRRGSWDFSISDVRSAEVPRRSFRRGAYLRVVGLDGHGREVSQQVYRCGIGRDTWENVAAKINEAKREHAREA